MKTNCPTVNCSSHSNLDPKIRPVVRKGFFYRKSDSRKIRRFYCRICRKSFSNATKSPLRYQKKRRINQAVFQHHCSGETQTRLALLLRVNRKTIVRKIRFLASIEKQRHERFLEAYRKKPLELIQFDDLETSEHTKCKPVSVTLAVDPQTRKVIQFQVSSMPAKGHLAAISRAKYGPRQDDRPLAWDQLMRDMIPYVTPDATWVSDENPHYPAHLKRHHPKATHVRVKGGRGAITGQGELKKLGFDPIFALNHTCAMLRANMSRLFRKTWNTTKNQKGLTDHLLLYIAYHNRVLT